MDIDVRIGPSTLIAGEGGAHAITSTVTSVAEAGFKAIEICPTQFQPVDPLTNPTFLRRLFGEAERRRLRAALQPFHVVTVHGSSYWVTTLRDGVEEDDIWTPYRELMRFAHDIGARLVSFHPLQRSDGAAISVDKMVEYNVAFGKQAVACADTWQLTAAFENMPRNGDWSRVETLHEIVGQIDSERFGLLFDIGHAVLQYGEGSDQPTLQVLSALEQYGDRIQQLHFHGVHRSTDLTGLRDHGPLTERNIVDPSQIMGFLKKKQFSGPIIFEIYFADAGATRASFQSNLQACTSAKQALLQYWI